MPNNFADKQLVNPQTCPDIKQHSNSRWLSSALSSLTILLLISACGGGSSEDDPPPPPPPPPVSVSISPEKAARFLTQTTFGATSDSIDNLADIGYQAWLNQQFAYPATLHLPLIMEYPDDDELTQNQRQEVWWRTALTADDQLRQRVAFALSGIFVVSDQGILNETPYGLANYYDILVRNAFGNYRDLLEEVTLSPMMGIYLSMLGNEKPNESLNIRPDENFAREVMQLFSIGLVELNLDGTQQLDDSGSPILTYDQDIIKAFAHVYTGWHFADNPSWYDVRVNVFESMKPFEDFHDTGEKRLLNGLVVPAGGTARSDLDAALDNLFNHPNVGPFITHQLIQSLVTSNPSPGYIERVSSIFNDNGQGERGDLGAVIKAILTDDEAINIGALQDTSFGKLKEPLLRFSQMWRAFNASAESGKFYFNNTSFFTGQAALSAHSVFHFFLPSYSPPGEISDAGLVGPEFQILDENYLTYTLNVFAYTIFTQFQGGEDTEPDSILIDISTELTLADDPSALVEHLNLLLMAGQMPDNMKTELIASIEAIPATEAHARVLNTIFLVVISPQFSVQK